MTDLPTRSELIRRVLIDRAVADVPDTPSRSEMIRRLLTEALAAKGYLPR